MFKKESSTVFNFFRAGGVEQLSVAVPNDLAAVAELDPKLWAALSMPTTGIDFDARTLELVDTDSDARIRVPEIKAAVRFALEHFADLTPFFAGKSAFPLAALKKESPLAKTAAALADADGTVALETVRDAAAKFNARPFNGDGRITPLSAENDDALAALIRDAVAVLDAAPDSAGVPAISEKDAENFRDAALAALAWREKPEADGIFPLDAAETAAAFDAIEAVRAKVEDFFARARLASYDPENAAKLNAGADDFAELSKANLTAASAETFPLARIVPAKGEPALPLEDGVNPAWLAKLRTLRERAPEPLFEDDMMTESAWRALLEKFAPYAGWLAAKPAGKLADFPIERLREIVAADVPAALAPLFARDLAEAPARRALEDVERLVCYAENLVPLLRNYVSFADFYALAPSTVFLAGTLFIDGRECALCIRVNDAGSHAALAAKSECFIAYCRCVRKSDGAAMTIAAILGDGNADLLAVGRNGVFVDKRGNDWDATVEKILEQPISLRQAIWAPYKKLARFVETQIGNFAAAREKKVDENLSGGVGKVAAPAGTAEKPAFDIGKFVGIFAAIGLALGAIGAALAALGSAFLALAWWQMPLAILGVFLLISVPSVILTAMKLRRRSLGPILDANSWAVNMRAKINISLGKAYTKIPHKPANSHFVGKDPYAENCHALRNCILALIVLAAAGVGAWIFLNRETAPETPPAESVPANIAPAENPPAE